MLVASQGLGKTMIAQNIAHAAVLAGLSYDARAANLLFQVVSRRYERSSLVLTANLSLSEWPTIFSNAATATTLIDRIVHHAEVITIEEESYRRRVAEAN